MMTSQNWQINVILSDRELSQLQHIKIWEKNQSPVSEIYPQLNEGHYDVIDLHLHNQDGLISTWCFYVIWSSGHTPYAYKI